ncbi:MAG: hypothetical protein KKA42_03685, partial [candidate division Zixibacteria bacterium]|nr:hypothetical protein [candidate division Zixibacteria bacterium]
MNNAATPIKESSLSTNLSNLAHTLARELAMACRKMAIYGQGHPQTARAIEKPFFVFAQFFRFKYYVSLNVQHGRLFVANIALKDNVLYREVLQYMQ